eukprot:Plantae.Rhodophyta-Hildenbrandia_rubra.ctg18419.p1 GENE.Plantae.Rhodophyta-Hildenbrandia_rubra.ctg18419~~Plantae.Rhodophyta-Hildenbrandia_rubra.ctg18419.p1  ORF type:complete len:576 (+),score=97.20 Plantae.Rhodophyta-Hildenbrandia_rubra.ctg18419:2768-4495(+)
MQPPSFAPSTPLRQILYPFNSSLSKFACEHFPPHTSQCRRPIQMTAVQPSQPASPTIYEEGVYCYVACSPTRNDYLERVLNSKVYDVATESSVDPATLLSARLQNNVLLKREDTQQVFSFKLRGAYNMMAKAGDSVKSGVVAASAGNHAQGVALAASQLGVDAVIVMPVVTPRIKVDAVRRRGADVVLFGDNFDEAKVKAIQMAKDKNMVFVPPFDHPDIIAGQGTIGLELLKQCDKMDAIFVPVGGGGLIAGIATVIKRLRPRVKVIGVEPKDAATLKTSLDAGRRVKLETVGSFADGVAVIEIGKETFRLCKDLVDEVILVDNDEICAAIKDVFEDTRSILEPAGALSVAGVKRYVERTGCKGENLVAIASGANTNFDRLRYVSERAEIGERREAVFAVTIPEKPGQFLKLIQTIGPNVNVTEFNYRYSGKDRAHVFVAVSISGRLGAVKIIHTLRDAGFEAMDLTDNEMAKLHLRHLVGGTAEDGIGNEMVYRFEFPERPGALIKFLKKMRGDWNITMFHYRNHGADVGRVLVGIDVPKSQTAHWSNFVRQLGYAAVEETKNPAYELFLRHR